VVFPQVLKIHQKILACLPFAIPEEEHARYMPVMIYRRLRMLRRILRCAQKDNTVGELRTSVFVKELIADIHATRYAFWRYPHWRLWRFLASAGK